MKKILFSLFVCAAFVQCKNSETTDSKNATVEVALAPPAAENVLTPDEEKSGVKLLFDGKSLSGWHNFKKTTIGKGWVIDSVEKAIHLAVKPEAGQWNSDDGGDIMTEAAYENYELSIEWKIDTCGNSGIIYNVLEDPKAEYVWHTGPEMQVLDNKCHPDAKIIKHRAGDLYDMISVSKETVRPALEWNQAKLVQNKGKVEHWLNGEKVVEYDMNTPAWKDMIAKSKFKDMPLFGKSMKGHIALQDHGNKVWFRNIKIKTL
jgi:cytochrome c